MKILSVGDPKDEKRIIYLVKDKTYSKSRYKSENLDCEEEIDFKIIIYSYPSVLRFYIPCPVCLERFLGLNEKYDIDSQDRIYSKNPNSEFYNGVSILHWGMAGTEGICYKCEGRTEPEW